MIELDEWQREVMTTEGNICLRSGRQVGKSTVIAVKTGDFAAKNNKKVVLVIASVERQAALLFEKILAYLMDKYASKIKTRKDKPTKHKIQLKNGSVIHCLPTGLTGHGIRGYTVDLLIADEAAFIPEAVWTAVTPMLATTKGTIILLSTPFGRAGYFYNCFEDKSFTKFHISSEDCPRMDKAFLEREKQTMTKLQYAQEYLGEFIDELMQFFPSSLVKDRMQLDTDQNKSNRCSYFMGVDIARYGGDQSTYIIVEKSPNGILSTKEIKFSENMSTTHVIGQIKELHRKWGCRKIYLDDGGLGAPVLDFLLEDIETRRYVEGLNNSKKTILFDPDKKQRRRILKEDLYANTLALLEQKKLILIKDDELFRSMTSIQYEYTTEGSVKIFGKYTHLTEGLIRACWCVKDKSLNIWIA